MSARRFNLTKESTFSLWRRFQVLLDISEMEALCDALSPVHWFNISQLLPMEQLEIDKGEFLRQYSRYIEGLKNSQPIEIGKALFSAVTVEKNSMKFVIVDEAKCQAKPVYPVIHMQPYRFAISSDLNRIHSMIMSREAIDWGVQFSYPQVFHNGNSFIKGKDMQQFPNTVIFQKLIAWLRLESTPIKFIFNDKIMTTSLRLGKKCFSWIHTYSRLSFQGKPLLCK